MIASLDIKGRAEIGRPHGPSVELVVYPRASDGRPVNATRRLTGPYETPITHAHDLGLLVVGGD